ncbi:MAG: tetratricopeptide repeat protein, partial [Myxococcales bacterium]|nr:tetratricopeptide repeat protein [Myxococcales bacterium]
REALLAELAPPADPEVAAQVDEVRALLAKISANTGTGRHDQSRTLARDAVARAEALGYRPLTAEALVSLGRLQEQAGELAEAETSLQRAYWAAEASHHETTKAEAAALIVTVVGVRLARPGDVNVWRELALAILERVGQGREVQGTVLSSLGALARHQGDLARALDYYKRALELYLALRGPEHPTVALARNNVAAVLAVTGERSEALAQFEAALASLEASFGPRHPLVGYVLINIGMIQYVLGDLDRAAAFQERALTLYDELGPDHPNVAAASNNLATVHLARRDYDLARDHLDVALAIRERHLDLDHPDLAPTLINTGMVALEEGSLDDAERYFLAAASILERHFGPDTPALFYSLTGRGRLELARGRPYAATLLLEEALTKTRLAADDRELALCQFALAQALVELHGVDAQALELAGRARAAYDVDDVHLAARRDEIAAWMRSVAPGGS